MWLGVEAVLILAGGIWFTEFGGGGGSLFLISGSLRVFSGLGISLEH